MFFFKDSLPQKENCTSPYSTTNTSDGAGSLYTSFSTAFVHVFKPLELTLHFYLLFIVTFYNYLYLVTFSIQFLIFC